MANDPHKPDLSKRLDAIGKGLGDDLQKASEFLSKARTHLGKFAAKHGADQHWINASTQLELLSNWFAYNASALTPKTAAQDAAENALAKKPTKKKSASKKKSR